MSNMSINSRRRVNMPSTGTIETFIDMVPPDTFWHKCNKFQSTKNRKGNWEFIKKHEIFRNLKTQAVKSRGKKKNHICPMSANVKASAEEARKR